MEWQEYLDQEDWQRNTKGEYYLAQIAAQVAVGRGIKDVKTEDFLIKFITRTADNKPVTQEELEERVAMSKAAWFAITGLRRGQ